MSKKLQRMMKIKRQPDQHRIEKIILDMANILNLETLDEVHNFMTIPGNIVNEEMWKKIPPLAELKEKVRPKKCGVSV